jgi:hypothetical protein
MTKLTRNLLFALAATLTLFGLEAPATALPSCAVGPTPYLCHCGTQYRCVANAAACSQWCSSILS